MFTVKGTAMVKNGSDCPYLLNRWTCCNQTWYTDASLWTPVKCYAKGVVCYLQASQGQGHSKGSHDQIMTKLTGSSFGTADPFRTKFKFDDNFVVMSWSLLRKDIAVSKQGFRFIYFSQLGLFIVCLFVLGSLQFWELSNRLLFISSCCCCWWLLVSCSPWRCALSREGLEVQCCVCNENEASLLDLIFFLFFFSFHHVVSKWSWADAVLVLFFFLQSSCAGGHRPHGGRNEVWRCCGTH